MTQALSAPSAKHLQVTSIASWYGSNRKLASAVGEELRGIACVAIVFAGGMTEAAHIGARTLLINDAHGALINMAKVMADRVLGPQMYRALRRLPFDGQTLHDAQTRCIAREQNRPDALFGKFVPFETPEQMLAWAIDYFVCCWMARHGHAGQRGEFGAPISMRFNGNGGDSATHFWNAVSDIVVWRKHVLHRANFTSLDFAAFLSKCCKDKLDLKGNVQLGIYADPPFSGPGRLYKHTFGEDRHRELARKLNSYQHCRVVCRFYDIPLVHELYPKDRWTYRQLVGKKQTNEDADELLLINGASLAASSQAEGTVANG